jgi:hypothetical protein
MTLRITRLISLRILLLKYLTFQLTIMTEVLAHSGGDDDLI